MKDKISIMILIWSSTLYGSPENGQSTTDNSIIIVAAAGLFLVSIIVFLISYLQIKKAKSIYKKALDKQKQADENQAGLLTNMTEDISRITQEAIENRNKILKNTNDKSLEYILSDVIQAENNLLDRTNDLIGFLRLKSKKIKIANEYFNFNNVLNEVSGSLASVFKGRKIDLIFDIDNDIPRFLIGDSLHLGQILYNLLEFSLLNTIEGEVKLKILIFHTFEDKTEVQFQISDTSMGLDPEKLDTLFEPYYNEETEEYIGLGHFVANELVQLMDGQLMVESGIGRGSTYTVTLPLQEFEPTNRRRYRLPQKILTTKKVFIVDSNYNSALAIKKMFAYFKHDVKVCAKGQFLKEMPSLKAYDIVIMDEEVFTPKIVEYFKKIKEYKDIKILGLSSLMNPIVNQYSHEIYDRRLKKPLNQERIFDLIIDLYKLDVAEKLPNDVEKTKKTREVVATQKNPIEVTPNITRDSFSEFAGAKLLIVEDNLINQKVLTTILASSGLDITLANNGEEAVIKVTTGKKEFDLVLMDINMPIMDGYTATQEIRATGHFDTLPIVSFTALVLESEVQKMFNAGINAFLEKPLNIGKLYTVFKMYIKNDKEIVSEEPKPRIIKTSKPHITSINIKEGIKHTNGNEALYMELLNQFISTYGDSDKLFEKLLEEHRYEQVKILCLDMKGLAGTIGAEDMYRKVDEIHKLFIYNNQSLLNNYKKDYNLEINRLKNSIREYLDNNKYS